MNSIIYYYSKTGNTEKIASYFADKFGAKLEKITDHKNRYGFFGFIVSGLDALRKKFSTVSYTKYDFNNFDLIVFASPIWAGKIAPATRTIIEQNKENLKNAKKIGFISSCEDIKCTTAYDEYKTIFSDKIVFNINISGKDIKKEIYKNKIDELTF